MRGFIGSALAVSVGMVSLAACGGGGDDALTKAEFIKQADAICKKYDDQSQAAVEKAGANLTLEQQVAVIENDVLPALRASHDEIAKLEPPKEDRDTINKMLTDLDDGIDSISTQLESNPQELLSSDANPLAVATADAKAYGLVECGSS